MTDWVHSGTACTPVMVSYVVDTDILYFVVPKRRLDLAFGNYVTFVNKVWWT